MDSLMTDEEILTMPQRAYHDPAYREQWLAERVRLWVAALNEWQRGLYPDAVEGEVTEWKS
jgi:hypothetical protein